MTYDEIYDSAKTLSLLATNHTLHLSSKVLCFEEKFPMYIGDDFVAINAFDMSKATELHGCRHFAVGDMVFFPDFYPVISERLAVLDVIG